MTRGILWRMQCHILSRGLGIVMKEVVLINAWTTEHQGRQTHMGREMDAQLESASAVWVSIYSLLHMMQETDYDLERSNGSHILI